MEMKSMVVYYSLEGNTRYVADKIAEKLGADMLRLEPVKPYPTGKISKFIFGGKSAVCGEMPELKQYYFNKNDYDIIILGTPVWAGTFTPPIKTFISKNNLSDKKIALYACSTGGNAGKCLQKLQQELGITKAATLSLIDPGKKQNMENDNKIEAFCIEVTEK
jgi:flavodoxin